MAALEKAEAALTLAEKAFADARIAFYANSLSDATAADFMNSRKVRDAAIEVWIKARNKASRKAAA